VSELRQIRDKQPRFGILRAHALLRRAGQVINHKRVERVWRKHGLQVPRRPKKPRVKTGRSVPCQAERPDHVWCYDFQEDALVSGRKIRLLNVLDEFTRQWLSVTVGVSLSSQAVIAALEPLFATRGMPAFVRSDNGPEFIWLLPLSVGLSSPPRSKLGWKAVGLRPTILTLAVRGKTGLWRVSTANSATSS
jgi:putative transposase